MFCWPIHPAWLCVSIITSPLVIVIMTAGGICHLSVLLSSLWRQSQRCNESELCVFISVGKTFVYFSKRALLRSFLSQPSPPNLTMWVLWSCPLLRNQMKSLNGLTEFPLWLYTTGVIMQGKNAHSDFNIYIYNKRHNMKVIRMSQKCHPTWRRLSKRLKKHRHIGYTIKLLELSVVPSFKMGHCHNQNLIFGVHSTYCTTHSDEYTFNICIWSKPLQSNICCLKIFPYWINTFEPLIKAGGLSYSK